MHISESNLKKMNDTIWLKNEHSIQKRSLTDISIELGITLSGLINIFNKQNLEIHHWNGSMLDKQCKDKLIALFDNINFIEKDRTILKPKELDFYFPEHNLAIELNGMYWHSELQGRGKKYHLNKFQMCKDKNIRLLQFWDYEWINKQPIILSKIKVTLGLGDKIAARKCKVQEIPSQQAREFLNINHLQGSHNSTINLGLIYNNEIVEVMSFSKSRFSKKYEYELTRLCSIQNTTIVGGVNKLLSYFIKKYNPNSIISYCDLRYGSGAFYEKLGFTYSHRANPNYFYFKPNTLITYSRQSFQKHKLKDKLETFDPDLTEWENMQNNGYDRIWDCGNDVWVWNKDNII